MKARRALTLLLVGLVAVAGCGYSLPLPIQTEVDAINKQTESVYATVRTIKKMGNDGKISATDLGNVKRAYGDLATAYENWRVELKRVIKVEIDNYEADDKYENSVRKLDTASDAFKKAADAVRGEGATPTVVPDWPVEAKELIVMTQNERKFKKAANAIHDQMTLLTWDEVGM